MTDEEMTDEEMAEEYADRTRIVDENTKAGTDCISLVQDYEGNVIDIHERIKQAFLAGIKASRPKWHKVADGDLPKENHFVLVLNKRTGYEIARHAPFEEYYLDNWVTIDNRSLIQTKNNPTVIAWCEIPKYTEE